MIEIQKSEGINKQNLDMLNASILLNWKYMRNAFMNELCEIRLDGFRK